MTNMLLQAPENNQETWANLENYCLTLVNAGKEWYIIKGRDDAARVSNSTRVIAVDTQNSNIISPSWGTYRTSVNAMEAATGYDIHSGVEKSVQEVIEARYQSPYCFIVY